MAALAGSLAAALIAVALVAAAVLRAPDVLASPSRYDRVTSPVVAAVANPAEPAFARLAAQLLVARDEALELARNVTPTVHFWVRQSGATVGEPYVATLWAVDPDGDEIETEVWASLGGESVPVERSGDTVSVAPSGPGRLMIAATAVDEHGASASAQITITVRHPHQPALFVALGDSVPAGTGLDPLDYVRDGDPCWRSERATYPMLVFDRVADRLGPDARFELLACAGATTDDLVGRAVPLPSGTSGSQLDRAVSANPGVITLAIGANNLRFNRPGELFDASGTLRDDLVGERLASARGGLDEILDTLVALTDATIVVTTYHDPAGDEPVGVPGCGGDCFAAASADVTQRLNDAIRAAVAAQPGRRVLLADAGPRFAGKGAPNGLGPDVLRGGGFGWLGEQVSGRLGGVHAFCDRHHGNFDTLVSAIDCIHPNLFGHRAYADEVGAALDASGALGRPG